VLMERVLV